MTHRLASWADRTLLPCLLAVLLFVDLATGLNWATSPTRALSSPSYDAAKLVMPMAAHGVIFLALAAVAAAALLLRGRSWWSGYAVCLLGAFWVFWTVLFTYAALGPRSSWQGVIFALALVALHCLSGLAASRPPTGRA